MEIYISNLRDDTTKENLITSFADLGKVEDIRIEKVKHVVGENLYAVVSMTAKKMIAAQQHVHDLPLSNTIL